jgi:hypothetical protein
LVIALCLGSTCALAASTTETIVLIRHGEKPPEGLGQLDCRGRNRAIRLPAVLAREFGKLDAIFASDPSHRKKDKGVKYDYMRPLETVEPVSKASGVLVDTRFGYKQVSKLETALEDPAYRNATVLVAWEHKKLVDLTRSLLGNNSGDPKQVPHWAGDDFDGINIVRIIRENGVTKATFERRHEGLDGQSEICPSP